MKYFTMVSRAGNPKNGSNSMIYTLISDQMTIHTFRGDKLAASINSGSMKVTNLAVSVKGLVSTNGAIDKYTTFDEGGNIVGVPHNVVLNRFEKDGKLVGYKVYTANGIVANVPVQAVVQMANDGLLANGKIRHTATGDIVSSIGGEYPIFETRAKALKAEVLADGVFFGSAINGTKVVKYAGIIVTSNDTETIAKMHTDLVKRNEALKATLKTFGYNDDELKSFGIKQASGAGFYAVYSLKDADEIMKIGKKAFSIGKILISCRDCSELDEPESFVIYSKNTKKITVGQQGTEKSDKFLESYHKEITQRIG